MLGARAMHGRGWQGKCQRGVKGGKLLAGIWCRGGSFLHRTWKRAIFLLVIAMACMGIAGDAGNERTKRG